MHYTHTETHFLGSHTLLQTPTVTQMSREEAITGDDINRSGRHASRRTHHSLPVAERGCGNSKNRLSAVVGREKWKEMKAHFVALKGGGMW